MIANSADSNDSNLLINDNNKNNKITSDLDNQTENKEKTNAHLKSEKNDLLSQEEFFSMMEVIIPPNDNNFNDKSDDNSLFTDVGKQYLQ